MINKLLFMVPGLTGPRMAVLAAVMFACVFFRLSAGQAGAAELHTLNKVAAVVNGEMITLFDVQRYSLQEITRRGLSGADAESEAARQKIFQDTLDSMIMDILVRQEAERYKVTVSDAEADNEIRMITQRSQMTPKQFEDQLIIQGTTLAQFKEQIKKNLLRQRMMNVMVARKIVVTREEIERYYEEHKAEFTTQHSVDISMLINAPTENPERIREEITSGKISFADAARKYSTAPNAANGGKMGAIAWADLNPAWRPVLAGMQPGDVSPVMRVANNAGILLQLNSTIEDTALGLEEVAPQIENILREPRLNERFEEYSRQLRSSAVVEIRL
ncbi:MAG: SurA N-terminal domain-containing protein [Deltaproteobacteria bacterium]|nr:SurA N-terminal domain-containing protein [Deltaproteobacteria bacterium]